MPSPSEQLAQQILERLVQEKLLSQHDATALHAKLASGRLRQEDWRLLIELTITKDRQQ